MLLELQIRIRSLVEGFQDRLLRWPDEGQHGQSMVEYAIIAALIAVACMGAVQLLGGGITAVFQRIVGNLNGLGT